MRVLNMGHLTPVIPDVARGCPYPINKQQTLPASLWLFAEQVKGESAAMITPAQFVLCDRGVPDILSHTLPLFRKSPHESLNDVFIALSRAWAPTYDLIFWAKRDPSRAIRPDAVRLSDPDYQGTMEQFLEEALMLLGMRFEILPSDQNERIGFSTSRIKVFDNSIHS